jgi:hypothetical protein
MLLLPGLIPRESFPDFAQEYGSAFEFAIDFKSSFLDFAALSLLRGQDSNELSLNRCAYFSFAYSALAAMRMGMSGLASFQRARKS